MPSHLPSWSCSLLIAASLAGCSGGGNDELSNPIRSRDGGVDASINGSSAEPDAAEEPLDASPDAAVEEPDAGPLAEDAALDAPLDGGLEEAGGDASADAGGDDRNVIYATFGNTLVYIDPDDARLTPVGVLTDSVTGAQTYVDTVMHWSGAGQTALATFGYHTPRLATVDLCTAQVTIGATVTRPTPASPNLVVEGLARHENGTWYVASGNATNTLSRSLGTIDVSTGVITNVGTTLVTSVQNDMDMLFFRGAALYTMDVATDQNRSDLFTLDLTTGAHANHVISTDTDEPLRLAYDASRDKVFAWRAGDRNLLEVALTTFTVTPIGETHPSTSFGNALVRGFFVGPPPSCL